MEGVIVRAAGGRRCDEVRRGSRAERGPRQPRAVARGAPGQRVYPGSSERWRARLASPAPGSITWGVEIDGVIAGSCNVGPSPDDDAGEDIGHVYAIYVEPRFARQGTGYR